MNKIPDVLAELYLKNLAYFKKQNPSIYHIINTVKPDHSNIIIDNDGKIDLVYKGRNIYGRDAITYVEEEVKEFQEIYNSGKRHLNISIPQPDSYNAPRFFHRHLDATVREMYGASDQIERNTIHHYGELDFLVVMGVGLGLHISELLDRTNIQNLLILETDFEFLTLSCFFTDWEDIYKRQGPDFKKSITLLAVDKNTLEVEQGSLWNELVKRAPHFPYNTIFYNHGRHDKYGEIVRKMTEDQKMFTSLWGFFDDESAQLNNITYNLEQILSNNGRLIPKRSQFKWDTPVVVCGSGPSLDDHIEQLISIKDKVIIISAGTSLLPMIKNNITPDFHLEMESDYSVIHSLSSVGDLSILKEIPLITGIQSTPSITSLFKDVFFFVKDSSAIGDLIEDKIDKLTDPTPTCVNAALSVAMHYNAGNIYLFGTDFGFYDKDNNHSKNSLYNIKGESTEILRKKNKKNVKESFKLEGYQGDCFTTNVYFTTKRRIELSITLKKLSHDLNIFNCADGLIIDKTVHIDHSKEIYIDNNDKEKVKEIFYKKSRELNKDYKAIIYNPLIESLEELSKIFIPNIEIAENNSNSLSSLCWSLSNYLANTHMKNHGSLQYFIRGTIWHYLLCGYSITYSVPKEDQGKLIDIWKRRFIDFLRIMPNQIRSIETRDRNEDDVSLSCTIRDNLPGF